MTYSRRALRIRCAIPDAVQEQIAAPLVSETISAARALQRQDPWSAIPEGKTCGCGAEFVVLCPEGIRTPSDDEQCMLCSSNCPPDALPFDRENVVAWQYERQAMIRMAERLSAETKIPVDQVLGELSEWDQMPGFRTAFMQILPHSPTRQAAWDAAMRMWIQGPEIAALDSPLVATAVRRRTGSEIDAYNVTRVVAKLKGMVVYDGPLDPEGARSMLDLKEKHKRDVVFTFSLRDGSKQRWRGNGSKIG